ncbi:putative aarF domain-containing protein kinase 2 [Lasioglossum baleicum]|uniref:putative aarF domain-containing protein kinase 2 n=1 Tax=Lasioglossum baleicum TaxID=434251 RepID=UPI003FCCF081
MGSRLTFSRVTRAIRRVWYRREHCPLIESNREYMDTIRFWHASAMRRINCEGSKRIVKAVLILSYESDRRSLFRENDMFAEKAKDQDNFFAGLRNAVLIAARIFVIGSVAFGLTVAYLVTRVTCKHAFPSVLVKSIEFLGPIFIKFGQWASTRKDIFPEDICRTLAQLQRTVSPHSWFYTEQLLKSIYGSRWREIFVKFENKSPIGSGCCAQVYKAWVDLNARVEAAQNPRISTFVQIAEYLRLGSFLGLIGKYDEHDLAREKLQGSCTRISDGAASHEVDGEAEVQHRQLQPVAVKILHPGIKDQLRRDLCIMRGLCKCATYIVPRFYWLSLTDCINEFSQIMENQVDMNREAKNLMQFSANFSEKKNVVFPRPYANFTQREILVESFHEGASILDFLEYEDHKLQEKLAKIGVKTILKMVGIGGRIFRFYENVNENDVQQVFRDNFIHCDMHPGNILVETDREPTDGTLSWLWKLIGRNYWTIYPRLIILDCGLVVSLNARCQRNLRDVFRSVLMGNGELAAEHILEHSSEVCPDPEGFKTTLRRIVDTHLNSKANVNVTTVMNELFSAMIRHKVKQDGSFSSVILSLAMIEGLGRSLYPKIDIFAEVLPFVFTGIPVYDEFE